MKGAGAIGYELILLRDRVSSLKKANKAAIKRKSCKKKRIQKQGTLTKGEGEEIIAQQDAKK